MKETGILIFNGLVLYDNTKIYYDKAIYIENNIIKEIEDNEKLISKYENNDLVKKIDAKNKFIIPGLINSHMHFYSTFARGISLNSEPNRNFTDILKKMWWRLDKGLQDEDNYYSAIIPLISAIKNGTTTLIDHHSSPYSVKGALNKIYNAYEDSGIRGLTCYEVSDRDGKEVCRQAIEENINFIEKYNNNKDSKVKGMFGLHAAFTIENDTFEEIMSRNVKSGFHIHVSEAVDDSIINVNKYNLSAVERLHKYGITGENSLFIHCNHLSEKDIEIIKDTKTNLVHNPQSNMKNGVGTANIIRYIDEGIRVGLGTDGMSSGMFDAVNFASLIHKHNRRDSNVGFMESYKLIMENNPAIASKLLGYDIGKIKENYKADLIILDYIPATPINDDNFWGHFLFGVIPSARVETNIVDGKILMENYKLINIDEEQISKEARKLASKIWEKI